MLLNVDQSLLVIIDVQEKLAPVVHQRDQLITRMRWLGEIAQELNVPTFVTEQYPKGLGYTVSELSGVFENARVFEKMHFSAVQVPEFMDAIQAMKPRKQVLLMGMETHVCILQSAVEFAQQGYSVFIVEDAVGSRRDSDKQAALRRLRQLGIQIITTEMAAYEWLHRSGTDQFRYITKNWIKG